MIKTILADDHPIILEGLRLHLDMEKDIVVSKVVSNGIELIESLIDNPVDVIIMDINMPKMDGIEATGKIIKQFPETKIIAFSQYSDRHFIKRILKAGAKGYLLKDTPISELVQAIRLVYQGTIYLGNNLPDLYSGTSKEQKNSFIPRISKREKEVLKLISEEMNTNEIANQMFISPHTVESHRARLLQKSGSKNTAGLIKWAMEHDLLG